MPQARSTRSYIDCSTLDAVLNVLEADSDVRGARNPLVKPERSTGRTLSGKEEQGTHTKHAQIT